MAESTPSYPFPQDPWPNDSDSFFSHAGHEDLYKQKNHELPVDETEEFNDPYSDLSLFLSKKIRRELEEHGSLKNWSGKIQSDLLQKILPEFKKAFPKYRLGASALKKMWEKVSYYYGKVNSQKGAVSKNGKLDVYYMIRENLRQIKNQSLPAHLPPYNAAHRLAVKLSECIATLDGVRPNLDLLTRTIWAAQKHLLTNISPMNAKSPYEEYGKIDKIIVKCMLELCSHDEPHNPEQLTGKILETIKEYDRVRTLMDKGTLLSVLSSLYAKQLKQVSKVERYHDKAQKEQIDCFITRQFAILAQYKDFSLDTKRLELVSRILALYPLANALPRRISDEELESAIRYIYSLNVGAAPSEAPEFDQSLLVFLNTEMHLYPNKLEGSCPEEILDEIKQSYHLAIKLPPVPHQNLKDLEIYIWNFLNDKLEILKKIPIDIQEILHAELGNILIDKPKQTFRGVVNETATFLRKMVELIATDDGQWEEVSHKAYIWALQQDLICRYIHFDPNTPLLKLLLTEWQKQHQKEPSVNHKECIDRIVSRYIEQQRSLYEFRSVLTVRVTILYKYMWYNLLSQTTESTYTRFIQYQKAKLKSIHPSIKPAELLKKVQEISENVLPLFPFPDEQ